MAGRTASDGLHGGTKGRGDADSQDLFNLLRYSHIFSAAVREVLELKILRETSPDPLSLSQFHLLKLISLNGKHKVGQVADFLGVSAPAASKNIDKLERLGLAARAPSKGDRRATLLASSPKGRDLVDRYEKLKVDRLQPVLRQFDTEELHELTRLLERFALALIEADTGGEGLCFRCSAYFEDNCPVIHHHDGWILNRPERRREEEPRP
jgi:DNA-binding MarR family transcriptional regulator